MSSPIETGTRAFASAVRGALMAAGFDLTGDLEVDPSGPFAPTGDEDILVTAAALVKLTTRPAQTLLGSPPAYVVERVVQLELAAAGPDCAMRERAVTGAALCCADIVPRDPTLGGNVERIELTDRTDDDLPPNGTKVILTFVLRVLANDPLGMS